jgi:hypothetical protein
VDTAVAALDEIFTEHAAHNGTQAAAYAATQAAGGNNNG